MLTITIGNNEFFLSIVNLEPVHLSDHSIWPLYVVELLSIILTLLYISRLIFIFDKTSLFHKNLSRISQALLISYYPSIGARAVLLLYELNFLSHEDSYLSSVIMVSACFVRLWNMNVVTLYLPSIIVERAFASKYISDYERTLRSWIYKVIIPVVYIISTNCYSHRRCVNSVIRTTCVGLFFITYCLTYVILFRRDLRRLQAISSDVHNKNVIYTLSTKFQLKENLRVLKIVMRLSIMVSAGAVFACLSFLLATRLVNNNLQWNHMGNEIVNVCHTICANIIVWVYTIAIGGFHLRLLIPWNTEVGTAAERRELDEHRGATNAYFHHLATTWEK
ncbi:Sre G protein-coupled chemoreceptor [Ostertagia ostertagi]